MTFPSPIEQEAWEKGYAEGYAEGRAEGYAEGRAEGFAKGLLDLLAKRFGPVPKAMKKRIASAGVREVRRWALRVLDASSIEEVCGIKPDQVVAPPRSSPVGRPARRSA